MRADQAKIKHVVDNQSGAAAVEFALVLLPLMALIFGVLEFGLYLFNQQVITNASREAARAGIVARIQPTRCSSAHLDTLADLVDSYSEEHLVTFGAPTSPRLDPPIACRDDEGNFGASRGDTMTVSVAYDYDFLFLSGLGLGPKTLRAVSQMRLE